MTAALVGACTSQQSVNLNTGTQGEADLHNSTENTVTPTAAVGVGPGATANASGADPGKANGQNAGTGSGSGSAIGSVGASGGVHASAGAKGEVVFSEDFQRTDVGLVPNGWVADDGVGVVSQGRSRCLGVMQAGNHQLRTPAITWPAGFRIEVDVTSRDDTRDYIKLSVVGVEASFGGSSSTAKLSNASDLLGAYTPFVGKRALVTFEKNGVVLRTSLDGKQILMSRKSDMPSFGSVPLTIDYHAGNPMCIYRITVRSQ